MTRPETKARILPLTKSCWGVLKLARNLGILKRRDTPTLRLGNENLVDRKMVAVLLKDTKVTEHAEQKLVRKLQRSRLLSVRQISDSTHVITHPQVFEQSGYTSTIGAPASERTVEIVSDGLVCSCRFTTWEGHPCEDALAVTGGILDSTESTLPYYLGRIDDFFFPRSGMRPQHQQRRYTGK